MAAEDCIVSDSGQQGGGHERQAGGADGAAAEDVHPEAAGEPPNDGIVSACEERLGDDEEQDQVGVDALQGESRRDDDLEDCDRAQSRHENPGGAPFARRE